MAAILSIVAGGGFAAERVELPSPGSDAWRHLAIPKVEKATVYEAHEESGRPVLRAESRCAASGLAVSIGKVDLDRTPILHWDWRIEKGLDVGDERSKGGDDFAARVIVMFEYDAAQASFSERALHRLAETAQGEKLPGRSLAYVWSSRQPAGESWKNPFRTPTILLSRGQGISSAWQSVSADIRADYRRHWKAEPPPPVGLAVLTDADNTCGHSIAYYADFHFSSSEKKSTADER